MPLNYGTYLSWGNCKEGRTLPRLWIRSQKHRVPVFLRNLRKISRKKSDWLAIWPVNTIPSKANYFLGTTSWWTMCGCESRNGSWQTHVSHMWLSRKSTNTELNLSLYACKDERTFRTILLQLIPSNATKLFSATSFLNVFLHFESSACLTGQSSVCHFQWSWRKVKKVSKNFAQPPEKETGNCEKETHTSKRKFCGETVIERHHQNKIVKSNSWSVFYIWALEVRFLYLSTHRPKAKWNTSRSTRSIMMKGLVS